MAARALGPAPAPKKKSILRRWWFWVVVAVVLIVAINAINGGGGADEEPAASVPGQEQESDGGDAAEEPAAEAPADEALPGVGDTVAIDGFEVVVTSIETGVPSVGSGPLSEQAQGAFVLLEVQVTNTGGSAESVLSSSFTVLDADEREFDASPTASIYLGDSGFAFEQINPGNTASGILVFDLPEGTAPQTLEFAPGFFGEALVIALS